MSSILVVGAGELGNSVLRALALSFKRPQATQITVLLRPETLSSPSPAKKQNIDEIQSLGVKIQSGDFITASVSELAAIFQPFGIVIQCAGYGMPKGSRLADLVEEHFKTKFTRELWTIPKLKEDLENDPGNLWKKYRVVFATGHGVFWGKEESFNVKRQIPLTSVPDYLEHNGEMIEDLE
ncbi:hypothetical protein Neosp_014976 [[Neocosmospora] mangrovei]